MKTKVLICSLHVNSLRDYVISEKLEEEITKRVAGREIVSLSQITLIKDCAFVTVVVKDKVTKIK